MKTSCIIILDYYSKCIFTDSNHQPSAKVMVISLYPNMVIHFLTFTE